MKNNIFLFVILFFLTSINISAQLPGSTKGKPLNWYSLDVKAQTLLFLWAIAGILLYFVFNIDITAIF